MDGQGGRGRLLAETPAEVVERRGDGEEDGDHDQRESRRRGSTPAPPTTAPEPRPRDQGRGIGVPVADRPGHQLAEVAHDASSALSPVASSGISLRSFTRARAARDRHEDSDIPSSSAVRATERSSQ